MHLGVDNINKHVQQFGMLDSHENFKGMRVCGDTRRGVLKKAYPCLQITKGHLSGAQI